MAASTGKNHLQPLEQQLVASWPPGGWNEVTVLLAVSGGADSMALLRAMDAVHAGPPGRLGVAHFNHRLRGADADADEQFVVEQCQRSGRTCHLGRRESLSPDAGGDGIEAAARAARYAFLQEVAHRIGARYVVTAHTADDQAETILHHILRGTGLAGLSGIPRTRPLGEAVTLIRPMLDISHDDVLDYLKALDRKSVV
jgi:tRNA(Ile)-lysidine synthase